jgi:hypothetical protein
VIITLDHIRETRLVRYELADGPEGDVGPVPYMKVERPGSYAPGYEHPSTETLKVRGCRISLTRRRARWHIDAIVVVLIKGIETVVEHVELGSDPVPLWLADLIVQASQEVA